MISLKRALKYSFPGFLTFFSLTLIGITIEDIIHNISLPEALSELHHYATPLIIGIIGGIITYVTFNARYKREKALVETINTEKKYRDYINNLGDSVFLHDKEGNITDINNNGLITTGYTFKELTNIKAYEIYSTINSLEKYRELTRKISPGEHIELKTRVKKKDGIYFPADIKLCSIEINKETFFLSVCRDTTEQEESTKKLEDSEKKFKMLSNLTFEGVFIHNNNELIETNASVERILGFKYDDLKGKNIIDTVIHPDFKAMVNKYINWENSPPYEIIGIKKDNSSIPIEIVSKTTKYNGENISVTAIRDISKRKVVEERLNRFHTAVEQSANTIIITDENGLIQYTNNSFSELTGYTPEEARGKTTSLIKSGKHSADFYSKMWNTIKSGNVWKGELCNKKKNGELYWEDVIITPVINDEKQITNYIAIKEDITEKKRIQQELLNVTIETEEKERIRFAEDLHDELGPILSGIKLYINELGYEDVDFEKRRSIVEYLKQFIDEAVTKTRSISHKLMPSQLSDYGLNTALKSYCNKISISDRIHIEFNSNASHNDKNKVIDVIIYRITIELINNSIKHGKAKNISINISEKANEIHLTYKDNGTGFEFQSMINQNKGLGLQNLLNRLKTINATLEFKNIKDNGIIYNIVVPINQSI